MVMKTESSQMGVGSKRPSKVRKSIDKKLTEQYSKQEPEVFSLDDQATTFNNHDGSIQEEQSQNIQI